MPAQPNQLAPDPGLSGLSSLFRYANKPLKRFEQARAQSARATAFELLGRYYLVLFEPELIEQVLVRDHAAFTKDPFIRDLEPLLGRGLLTSDGEHWKRQRRLAAPSFQRGEIDNYAAEMVTCSEQFLHALPVGRTFDAHAAFMHLTLHILARTLFGTEISRVQEVENALNQVMREYAPLRIALRVSLPPWLTRRSRRRIAALRGALDSVLLELIAERKRRSEPGTDLLSRLLAARDAGQGLSDLELRDETMTMFLAGHETTALALTYAFRLLALHPEAARRARAEVRLVVGARRPTVADLNGLTFTRAVLDEALRLFPPAWVIAREPLHACRIGEFQCDPGTEVLIVPWVMHRDPRFWKQPELFQPERWLSKMQLPRSVYLPFGAGPRVCIGHHFAVTEAMLVLATCLGRGSFALAQGQLLPLSPAVTLRPRDPVLMRFESD